MALPASFTRSGRAVGMVAALTLFLLLVHAGAQAQVRGTEGPGRHVALVVGNGAYVDTPRLPNAPRDAKAIAEALRDLGFEVLEATDLDQRGMLQELADFADLLDGAEVGLFFYAGHGLQVAGENYLVPVDARLHREAQLRFQTVPARTVVDVMEAAVPIRLVLLDACRDNPMARTLAQSMGVTRSTAVGRGLARLESGVGTLIAYATAPGEVAEDGTDEHSPFTAALLEHIGAPGLEVRQVLSRVRGSVLKATDNRQVPWDSSSLTRDFYFKAVPDAPVPKSPVIEPVVPDNALEVELWQSAERRKTPAAYQAYRARFCPGGAFCTLADEALVQPVVVPPAGASPPEDRRCQHVMERVQLGELLTDEERTLLRERCRS